MRFLLLLAPLAACTPLPTELLAEDASASGADGERGPLGADLYTFMAQARVTERMHYEVVVPVGGEAPYPLVTMVHGGFVDTERYRWLTAHLASRGYVVVAAEHPANLAITQIGNSEVALSDFERRPLADRLDADAPAAVMGHSLGGVIAAMTWNTDGRYAGLGLLASFPAAGTAVETRSDGSVLSLWGSEDGGDEEEAMHAVERFDTDANFARIDGMNHYAWTDDASASELGRDGVATRPDDETRPDALRVLDTWLDAVLYEDAGAASALSAGQFANVEWNP
ncbi:MAG: hypothetical protein KC912_14055 [Proteobacteria bacterium]|nr:hypothetical protein [Pseudomonadota bacterium]